MIAHQKKRISELESEIEETKEKAEQEKIELGRVCDQNIAQIRNNYELEKQNFEKKRRRDKDTYEAKMEELIEEHQKKIEEMTEEYDSQIEELKEKLANVESMFENQSKKMQD